METIESIVVDIPRRRVLPEATSKAKDAWRFETSWARSEADVREAQRLRYAIFAGEMGARLTPPPGSPEGLDIDYFDHYCDHLLVRVRESGDDSSRQLVGTYRVLGPAAARRAGRVYTESEFDLAPIAGLRSRAVELGRACIHPQWRCGGVISALWGQLGGYMLRHRLDTMFGCASIDLSDGGAMARLLWQRLRQTHLVGREWQVQPLRPFPVIDDACPDQAVNVKGADDADIPPLLKGYLRCGAKLLGPPSFDALFNTADLPIIMRLDDLPKRYRKQFLTRR